MKESLLMVKSKSFALIVIQVCKELRAAKCEGALINQFLRSGTSIGANIREAFYAHSKLVPEIGRSFTRFAGFFSSLPAPISGKLHKLPLHPLTFYHGAVTISERRIAVLSRFHFEQSSM